MSYISPMTIKKPRLSEKSTNLRDQNQYIFDVDLKVNKNVIKEAIEKYYRVKVEKVRIIRNPAKPKTWMRNISRGQDKKKAIVTVKEGQKIELGV
ncbi:MAG: 50S ribosomal protein L23 [Minisyncoccia bacterium]